MAEEPKIESFVSFLGWLWWSERCRWTHGDHHAVISRTSATEKIRCLRCGHEFRRIRADAFD